MIDDNPIEHLRVLLKLFKATLCLFHEQVTTLNVVLRISVVSQLENK
jgi:hypothetical protein